MLGAIAAAALLVFVPVRFALALPLLVLAYFLVALVPVEERMSAPRGARWPRASATTIATGSIAPCPRAPTWPCCGRATANPYVVWQNEFFNRSVGTVYRVASPLLGGLAQTRLAVDAQAGIMRGPDGRPVRLRYLLVDNTFTPAGKVIARDTGKRMSLYELAGPLRSAWKVTGLSRTTRGRVRRCDTRVTTASAASSACICAATRASSRSPRPSRPGWPAGSSAA